MKKIVFLAPYPTQDNIKEGMMQRIAAIDELFPSSEWEKSYITPSFKSFSNKEHEVANGVMEYKLSIWTGKKKLLFLINQADIVYCHSLYGVSICGLFYWRNVQCPNTIWDVHGIIPEELEFAGVSKLKIKLFEYLENIVAHNVTKITTVTHAMQEHLQRKYPDCKAKFHTYAILPITIVKGEEQSTNTDTEIVLLYSGNTQKYQNIPLMAQSIAKLIDRPGLRFEILTGSPQAMYSIFEHYGIKDKANVHINSVLPSELDKYYSKAHYGYVLRDDIDVNRVACPTKIVEYLAYGLRPVVLQPFIGDFAQMGYEYIDVKELSNTDLQRSKSTKNIDIYQQLIIDNNIEDYKSFINQI